MLPALLTAYDDAGQVSTERTTSLVSALNEAGVDGYFVTGTSGEYYLLSAAERLRILQAVASAAGDRHIVFQVAASDQREVRELPLLGYTIPGFTGRVLGTELLASLAADGTLAGLKYTSSDLAILARLRAATPDSFSLLLGSDDLLVAALSLGADGGIGGTFNL